MTINVKRNGFRLHITRMPNRARNGQKTTQQLPDFSIMNCLAWVFGAGPVPAYPTKVTYRKHRHVDTRGNGTVSAAGMGA